MRRGVRPPPSMDARPPRSHGCDQQDRRPRPHAARRVTAGSVALTPTLKARPRGGNATEPSVTGCAASTRGLPSLIRSRPRVGQCVGKGTRRSRPRRRCRIRRQWLQRRRGYRAAVLPFPRERRWMPRTPNRFGPRSGKTRALSKTAAETQFCGRRILLFVPVGGRVSEVNYTVSGGGPRSCTHSAVVFHG